MASKMSERIELSEDETSSVLDRRIVQMTKQLESSREGRRPYKQIKAAHKRAEADHKDKEQKLKSLLKLTFMQFNAHTAIRYQGSS